MREAGVTALLERPPHLLRRPRRARARQAPPRPARARRPRRAHARLRGHAAGGRRARRGDGGRRRGAAGELRRAAGRLGGRTPGPTTSTTSPPSSGSRSARSPTPPTSPASPRRPAARPSRAPPDLDLGARRASSTRLAELASRLDAPVQLGRHRDRRAPARGAALDLGLPAPPRPRPLRVGLREDGRPQPGAQGAVRRRVRHRQDDGRPGARARPRPRPLPPRPRDRGLEVHRRDREEPRPRLRRRRGLERDPLLRRGRRALRQALRGARRPRPLRQHRGRLPAAEDGGLPGRGHPRDELPPEHGRRVPAPPRRRRRLPVPGARGPRAHLEARPARRRAGRRRHRRPLPRRALQALRRLDPQLLADRRVHGRRRHRPRSAWSTSSAPSRSSTTSSAG